jgi:hypothetical protein
MRLASAGVTIGTYRPDRSMPCWSALQRPSERAQTWLLDLEGPDPLVENEEASSTSARANFSSMMAGMAVEHVAELPFVFASFTGDANMAVPGIWWELTIEQFRSVWGYLDAH